MELTRIAATDGGVASRGREGRCAERGQNCSSAGGMTADAAVMKLKSGPLLVGPTLRVTDTGRGERRGLSGDGPLGTVKRD